MKVEHITFGFSSTVRDTDDIDPITRKYFKFFQNGNVTKKIEGTPFTCKVQLENGIAIFDLLSKDRIVCTNVCCFAKADRDTAYLFAEQNVGRDYDKLVSISPKEDRFIITIMKDIMAAIHDIPTAGEIELYIYDAIYLGLVRRNSSTERENISANNITPVESSEFKVFKTGKLFPWEKYIGIGDAVVPVFNQVSFDVIFSLTNLKEEEINIFQKGEFESGLFSYKNVPFLYFDFKEYSFDISLNINKLKEKEINNWLNADSDTLRLFLIDGDSGILKAMRMIRINFMEEIRDILENQTELTVEQTERIINEVINQFTTRQMMSQSITKMRFGVIN